MTLLARRDVVATIASLAGTALPFGFAAEDRGSGATVDGDGATADRGDTRNAEGEARNDGDRHRIVSSSADLTGVVDRIESGVAAVLIERAADVVDERLVRADQLPAGAREEGAVLSLTLVEGEIERLRHDGDATRRRRAAAGDRFDALADDAPP